MEMEFTGHPDAPNFTPWGLCGVPDNHRSHPFSRLATESPGNSFASCFHQPHGAPSTCTSTCGPTSSSEDISSCSMMYHPQPFVTRVKRKYDVQQDDPVELVRKKARYLDLKSHPASPAMPVGDQNCELQTNVSLPMETVDDDGCDRSIAAREPQSNFLTDSNNGFYHGRHSHLVHSHQSPPRYTTGEMMAPCNSGGDSEYIWAVECHGENSYPWDDDGTA